MRRTWIPQRYGPDRLRRARVRLVTAVPHYLLLGAGFSRNWGGWVASEAFEYLLGSPEILADPQLRDLLWRHQLGGGFEDALAEVQTAGRTSWARQPWTHAQLVSFQGAVGRMFDDMNRAFLTRTDLEFRRDLGPARMVRTFLSRFDAIFTLNQDVLLEQFYLSDKVVQSSVSPCVPGMLRVPHSEPIYSESLSRAIWHPRPENELKLQGGQPYIKLHGSANWFSADGQRLLIIGGAKQQEIGRNPILSWYAKEFARCLQESNSRLLVIGYGFRDNHVNDAIGDGVTRGLRMFVIDPQGAELAFKLNQTRQRAAIAVTTPL